MSKSSDTYVENKDFVPNPADQVATLRTADGGGDVTRVNGTFDHAERQRALRDEKAIDPKDDSVSPDAVVLPERGRTNDDAKDAIKERAKAAKKAAKDAKSGTVETGGEIEGEGKVQGDGTVGTDDKSKSGSGSTAKKTTSAPAKKTTSSSASGSTGSGSSSTGSSSK